MRIGLYGGAFDPIHIGHLRTIVHALAVGDLDEVWVVPAWEHAFGKNMAPFTERVAMCRDAVEDVFGPLGLAYVLDIESSYKTRYTVDLVEALKAEVPEVQLVLVIGQDNVDTMPQWHRWADLSKMVELLVVPDQGPMRSSKIRLAIENGDLESVRSWLSRRVYGRIEKSLVYGKKGVDFQPPIP